MGIRFAIDCFVDPESEKNLLSDPVIYANQLVEAGMDPRAILKLERARKIMDGGGIALSNWMDLYLDPHFCVNHGANMVYEQEDGSEYPATQITCPPRAILYPTPLPDDNYMVNNPQHRTVRKLGACDWCLGQKHTDCMYYKICRACLYQLDTLAHKGFKHACQMGFDGFPKPLKVHKPHLRSVLMTEAPQGPPPKETEAQRRREEKMRARMAAAKERTEKESYCRKARKTTPQGSPQRQVTPPFLCFAAVLSIYLGLIPIHNYPPMDLFQEESRAAYKLELKNIEFIDPAPGLNIFWISHNSGNLNINKTHKYENTLILIDNG